MINQDITLPYPFSLLANRVKYVKKVGEYEYSSTCPSMESLCRLEDGGQVHDDGSYPDRFRMLMDAAGNHRQFGWCRKCGYTWWEGKDKNEVLKLTDEERVAWQKQREEAELRRKQAAEQALALLSQERLWETYYNNLDDDRKLLYHARGISDYWISYYKFGYCDGIQVYDQNKHDWVKVPTLTIPLFAPVTMDVKNIKHRLIYLDEHGKYRYQYNDLPQAAFIANLEKPVEGHIILVEGEFKAAVVFSTLNDRSIQVVGIPGNTPSRELLELKDCSLVTVILDPDSYISNTSGHSALDRIVETIGAERCRIVDMPDKVDDLIVAGHVDGYILNRYIEEARQV